MKDQFFRKHKGIILCRNPDQPWEYRTAAWNDPDFFLTISCAKNSKRVNLLSLQKRKWLLSSNDHNR